MLSKQRPPPPDAQFFGGELWFDVKLKKPLGVRLVDGPGGLGSGVGVGEILESGSVVDLLGEVLAEGAAPKMWVQEGDELVQVDGQPVQGSRALAAEMLMASEVPTLTFSRKRNGYVKVVFPDGRQVTSPRAAKLSRLADKVGYDSGCRCSDGRCGACWHKDVKTGEVYILPLNVPGIVPSAFRAMGEGGLRPGEGEYESWVPLVLKQAPEEFQAALEREQAAKK